MGIGFAAAVVDGRSSRMRRGLTAALLLAASFSLPASVRADNSCRQLVATGNPDYPPFLWRDPADDNRLIGANASLMQLLSKEIGMPIEVRYVGSWARVLEEARLGRVDLIAGAFFNVDRLDYMDYLYPPFGETRSVVWQRQAATFKYQQWSDLRGRSGVTVINNSFGEEFDRYARTSLKIAAVPSLEQALKMLHLGRVDYLVYEEDPATAYIAKLGLSGLLAAGATVSNESLHLTLAHKSPCNTAEMRAALSRAMYKLAGQNAMKPLVDAGIQLWRGR